MICVLALLAAACGSGDGGAGAGWAGTVRDSGGVAVVSNPARGLWSASEAWTVVEDLVITDGSTPGLAFGEIVDLAADSRGRIIALDALAKAFYVFDAEGELLFTAGSPGSGPGELSDPFQVLVMPGDSVLVPDVGNARASVFGPDGDFARSFPLDVLDLAARRWATDAGGDVVARRAGEEDVLVRLGPDGGRQDTLATLSSPYDPGTAQGRMLLLAPVPVWTVLPSGGVAHGHTHEYRIAMTDSTGRTRRVVTRPLDAAPVGEAERAVVRDGFRGIMEAMGAPASAVTQMMNRFDFWDRLPLVAAVRAGPNGSIWVQRADPPANMEFDELNVYRTDAYAGDRWDVFDRDGRYLGEVRTPAGTRLTRLTGGHLYGVRLDALDVPVLVRLRLVEGGVGR